MDDRSAIVTATEVWRRYGDGETAVNGLRRRAAPPGSTCWPPWPTSK
jgi:hypothetical protein